MHLKGKKAFVTGGTEGIGAAIVAQLVARGAEVVTCARHEPGQAPGPGVSFRRCDLTSAADREALIAWLVSTHPDLAVLVNNAAVQHALDFMQADVAQIQAATSLELALNLEAPIALSAGLLPLLARQPEAAIVNVTTGLALAPKQSAPVYSAALLYAVAALSGGNLRSACTGTGSDPAAGRYPHDGGARHGQGFSVGGGRSAGDCHRAGYR